MLSGVGFVASRPALHRTFKLACLVLPGLQTYLRRFLPPQPAELAAPEPPAPAPSEPPPDPNAPYLFNPGDPPGHVAVVTVEALYHLSRSL